MTVLPSIASKLDALPSKRHSAEGQVHRRRRLRSVPPALLHQPNKRLPGRRLKGRANDLESTIEKYLSILLFLQIDDDGHGFDPDATTRGMGLGNRTERADAIGGTLEVGSQPGAGTTVRVRIPL